MKQAKIEEHNEQSTMSAETAKIAKRTETAKSAKCDMKSWQAVRRLFSKLY